MHIDFPYCYITNENNLEFLTAMHIPLAMLYWAIMPIILLLFAKPLLKQSTAPLKPHTMMKYWTRSFILNLISGLLGVLWLAHCPPYILDPAVSTSLTHTIKLDFFRSTFLGGLGTWFLAIVLMLWISENYRKKSGCLNMVIAEDIMLIILGIFLYLIKKTGYHPDYPFEFYSQQLNISLPDVIFGFLPYMGLVFTGSLLPIQFQLAIALPAVKLIMSNSKENMKDFLKYRNDRHIALLSLNILLTILHILFGTLAHYALLEGLALASCIVQFWYLRQTWRLCRLRHLHCWQVYTTLTGTTACILIIIYVDILRLLS